MKPLNCELTDLPGCCAFAVIYGLNCTGYGDDNEQTLDFNRGILATTSNRENTRGEINALKRLGFKVIARFKRIDGKRATIRLWYRKPTKTKPKKLIKTPKHHNAWEMFL